MHGEDVQVALDGVDVAAGVPRIGVARDRPEGLLGAAAADEDRHVGLHRARLAQRVLECVEAALVGHELAVEQAAHERDGLLELVQSLAHTRAEVDAERLVLALEPGAADAQDRAPVRDMVQRHRELRRDARVAERVRPDHEAQPDALRDRRNGRQEFPALEDGLLPRPLDGEQMVPGPDRVPACRLCCEGRVPELRPGGGLGPQLQPELDAGHRAPTPRDGRGRP